MEQACLFLSTLVWKRPLSLPFLSYSWQPLTSPHLDAKRTSKYSPWMGSHIPGIIPYIGREEQVLW